MRCLVLGGAGFVGSHVCEELLRRGHEVSALDNLESGGRRENVPEGATLVVCDIRQWSALACRVGYIQPEVIIHLAAQADVVASCEDPHKDAETNIIGLLNVLKAATGAGTRRIVFASSGGTVYGPNAPIPTPETAPLDPICPYGISKAAGEWHIRHWAERNGREWVALRLGNVYGPRDRRGVVSKFARMRLRGETPTVRSAVRDYVWVNDVAHAFCQAADIETATGAYNISPTRAIAWSTIITEDVLGEVDYALFCANAHPQSGGLLHQNFTDLLPGEVPECLLNSCRAHRALFGDGYTMKSFRDGVAETVAWVREDEEAKG